MNINNIGTIMELYTDIDKKSGKVMANNTAASAWLVGRSVKEQTEAKEALDNLHKNPEVGNSRYGIPTIRERLQYRADSATAVANVGDIDNIKDVVNRRVAQLMYGEAMGDEDLYQRICEEYTGSSTPNRSVSFFTKLFGGSGTQVSDDAKTLGLGFNKEKAMKAFTNMIRGNYKPKDSANLAQFNQALDKMTDFSLESLSEVFKYSGPAEDLGDLADSAGMMWDVAKKIAEGTTKLNPMSFMAAGTAFVDFWKSKKRFKWIRNAVFGESLIGPEDSHVGNVMALRSRIMGLPPALLNAVDPLARAYNNNVIATQHVMTIVPGIFDYTGIAWATKRGFSTPALEEEMKSFLNGTSQTLVFDATSITRNLIDTLNKKNRRLANFSPQIGTFLRVYNTLMSRFIARLSPTSATAVLIDGWKGADETKFDNRLVTTGWGGIEFAINSNTTVSETASSSWGQGTTEGMMQAWEGALNKVTDSIKSILGSGFTDFFNKHKSITNFPKHWEGSSFNKSYTLSFRLECPYGSTDHLLEYVYKPFASLLAMTMPIFENENSYSSPFIVRVDCPGFFSIDAGAITSLDIRRGVDENSWSAQGMATCLEITMTIMDMYETMALPVGPASFFVNYPMQTYIDNIAGMNYKEIYTGGSFASAARTYAAYTRALPDVYKNVIKSKASEKAWKLPGSLWGTSKNR